MALTSRKQFGRNSCRTIPLVRSGGRKISRTRTVILIEIILMEIIALIDSLSPNSYGVINFLKLDSSPHTLQTARAFGTKGSGAQFRNRHCRYLHLSREVAPSSEAQAMNLIW